MISTAAAALEISGIIVIALGAGCSTVIAASRYLKEDKPVGFGRFQ